ncbi:TPA: hypothetical protein ACNVSN_005419, partial [Citrobacter freundii]
FTRISIIRPGSLFCITTSLIVKITSANHPVIHTPPAATSWASCLFAVGRNIFLLKVEKHNNKK